MSPQLLLWSRRGLLCYLNCCFGASGQLEINSCRRGSRFHSNGAPEVPSPIDTVVKECSCNGRQWARRAGLVCKYVLALLCDVTLHIAVCQGTSSCHSRGGQVVPKCAEVGPKNVQVGPKNVQVGPKSAKVGAQIVQVGPKSAQVHPKSGQVGPISDQAVPEGAQVAYKLAPKAPKLSPGGA